MTFGKRLSGLRKEKGVKQYELAKILNKSNSALAMYKVDQREPNFETLVLLSDYFGVTVDYLLNGDLQQGEPVLEEQPVIENDLNNIITRINKLYPGDRNFILNKIDKIITAFEE
jgi:transcriptional regulator with XRE-family HTH domain